MRQLSLLSKKNTSQQNGATYQLHSITNHNKILRHQAVIYATKHLLIIFSHLAVESTLSFILWRALMFYEVLASTPQKNRSSQQFKNSFQKKLKAYTVFSR